MKWDSDMMNKRKKFHFDNIFVEDPQLFENIVLYQIGDLSCEGGYTIGEHNQFCYEISYVVSGEGVFFTDGKPYQVRKGDIYLSLPGEIHNGIADKINPFRYFYVGFNFEDCKHEQSAFNHIKKMFDQVNAPALSDKFNIRDPFVNIFREIINAKNFTSLMISTYLHQIVVLAYRNYFDNWEKEYKPQNNSEKSKQVVYDIINYIDVNLCKVEDLSEIAEELGYSYSYISRVFSHETGLNIQEYYNKRRFEKAVELLKRSDMSITQIAEDLQYKSIHSFSKAFRKNFGISPSEYQNLFKKTTNEQS